MTLLYELRHTIHGAALSSIAVGQSYDTQSDKSFLKVPLTHAYTLWEAAKRLSTPEQWGLTKGYIGVMFEPYTYATTLISECFKLINEIAVATDVTLLLPTGHNSILLNDKPPSDEEIWSESMGKRLAALG